jgi:hypothetical protein
MSSKVLDAETKAALRDNLKIQVTVVGSAAKATPLGDLTPSLDRHLQEVAAKVAARVAAGNAKVNSGPIQFLPSHVRHL